MSDADVVGLVTLQFHTGGLFDGEPVDDTAHLVRAAKHGTPGPTLCGIDRFAKDSPGWSVGGGIRRHGHWPMPCIPCDEVRERDYPDLPITGMFAVSYMRVTP